MKRATYFIMAALILLGAQFFSPSPGEGAATGTKEDPLLTGAVAIELDGKGIYLFSVSGIGDETEVVERQGADKTGIIVVAKTPGRLKISDIVIKKIIAPAANDPLYLWRKSVTDGKIIKKNGAILFFDAKLREVARYNFYNAWPRQWKGVTFDGQGQSSLAEEIVLTVDKVERIR
jgi:phage tail-like protein